MDAVTPNPKRAREIFVAAVKLAPEQWDVYLTEVCGDDGALRDRVQNLLIAHQEAGSFLEADHRGFVVAGDDAAFEGPGTLVGPYKLMEQIGEGGMGLVFVAEQTQPVRRKVALKVIKPGMDTRQVVARFEAERQALAMMDHANIAKVLDGGETTSGRPYFVMELVKGVPITEFCDRNQVPVRERLELFLSVCRAVQHAHQKGIIHRDIKPTNVLVVSHDGTPVVKIIDFGVAKAVGQQLTDKTIYTQFTQMVGTPLYMSPEQAGQSGLDVDTRSDIYSLGVLLYEMLTGTTPFEKERLKEADLDEIRRIIREEEPPRPSTRVSTLGQLSATVFTQSKSDHKQLCHLFRGELDWIVMKALEKDRNRRYESASTLAADVQRYLNDEPVLACPPSASYRLQKFVSRNKAVLGGIGLALFFLVLIGTGVGWAVRDRAARQSKLNTEIEHALDEASKARELALKQTDNPYGWEAALAEAASELKRAQGLADQDVLQSATRERLQHVQALLDADEADRRFAVRFDEIRLEQSEVNMADSTFKVELAFAALNEAFQRYYQIAVGATSVEQTAHIFQQRPDAVQELLLAALEMCLDHVPKGEEQARSWLAAVLDAADTGPWRKRAQQAVRAKNWQGFEPLIDEALSNRQPPSVLLRLALKIPWGSSPISLKLFHRICLAYPGDFWANHYLAEHLQYAFFKPEQAIRYLTAAMALRPHNPAECVNLGNALQSSGDLQGAITAYREAIDGHPNYAAAHERLGLALESKGDLDGAIVEMKLAIGLRSHAPDHLILGSMLSRKDLPDKAVASYRKAVELNPALALAHYYLGAALLEKKECLEESIRCFQNAIACNRRAIKLDPRDANSCNNLAWILVTCPHAMLRDPAEGVQLAQKAVGLAPDYGLFWNTLGVAQYRAGNWKEAIAALDKARHFRNGGDSHDWFFLAMAYWKLGEKEQARRWYDQGVEWMDKHMPKCKELGYFRAEAAELLNIEED